MSIHAQDSRDSAFTLHRDQRQRLVLVDAQGRRWVDVEPVRCFPISHPDQWISICDAEGHELAYVRQPDALPPEARRTLEEELAVHEFVPTVTRIVEVVEDSESCHWQLETDRGPIRILTSDENAVRRLGPRRAIILDTTGIRYLIPDMDALDTASRRRLEQYM